MSKVVLHNVVSVDGFIADQNDNVGPLFDWYGNREHLLEDPHTVIQGDRVLHLAFRVRR